MTSCLHVCLWLCALISAPLSCFLLLCTWYYSCWVLGLSSFLPSNCLDTQKFLSMFSLLSLKYKSRKTLLLCGRWSHIRFLAGHFCGRTSYFAWLGTFCVGSFPVPQAPWHYWLLCLAPLLPGLNQGEAVTLTWEAWFVSLAGAGESLLLLCWHSGLGRKMFLISKNFPM